MNSKKDPNYTANSIQILSDEVAAKRFGYEKVLELSKLYPIASTRFLETMVEAAQLAGVEPELVAERYIECDMTIELPEEFQTIYADLVRERQKQER